MTYKMTPEMTLGKVVLNVHDLWSMLTFYQNKVGLDVLDSSSEHAVLGINEDNKELLELRLTDKKAHEEPTTGLYHVAFLVPNRREFANILFSLITQAELDIQGASDHGYSEALYFSDPEGNGIEIYHDKPKSEWTILPDGTIPGITEPLDANGVLAEKDKDVDDKMPHGTIIGHVHLMTNAVPEMKTFYEDVIGFDTKFEAGTSALFVAAGEYHHHVAMNSWSTKYANEIEPGDLGLNHYTIELPSADDLNEAKEHIASVHSIHDETDDSFMTTDPNGIQIKFTLQ